MNAVGTATKPLPVWGSIGQHCTIKWSNTRSRTKTGNCNPVHRQCERFKTMNKDQLRKNVDELIDKNKWRDILARFVDVLKINILMVDFEGQVLLSPANDRYGWNFFEKSCLGLNVPQADGRQSHILDKFVASAEYAECK